jgi:hypothetical protein
MKTSFKALLPVLLLLTLSAAVQAQFLYTRAQNYGWAAR